jgi:hypothetical protein
MKFSNPIQEIIIIPMSKIQILRVMESDQKIDAPLTSNIIDDDEFK